MTKTTAELAPPSPNFHATPTGGRLATTYDLECSRPIHGGSSVESGFEPGTLRPQSRDLTSRPPQPHEPANNMLQGGRGGLVVRSRHRDRRIAGSKPDSTEDPSCMGPVASQFIRIGEAPSHWCGAEAWRGCAAIQNYEVRPKYRLSSF
ncbi:hypothetical protein AVEN_172927-1 [Araneus ventricosus]|uniref:Uncharacterized protein n=1 Tax=Araneus ventricosus TaxID=182803 RepID=A0A4Y2GB81_ARAVE|nr:hypothetical protein AVEN_172927-1 [Araneus ventricosus]